LLNEFIARQADTAYLVALQNSNLAYKMWNNTAPLHRFLAAFRYRIYGDAAD
jgi:hypothetical protein